MQTLRIMYLFAPDAFIVAAGENFRLENQTVNHVFSYLLGKYILRNSQKFENDYSEQMLNIALRNELYNLRCAYYLEVSLQCHISSYLLKRIVSEWDPNLFQTPNLMHIWMPVVCETIKVRIMQ